MWLRLSDTFADDPVLLNVCRTRADRTRVLGWITELMLFCAKHGTDGYIPEITFREVVGSPRWRQALTSPPGGGIALLHRQGDACDCLKDRPLWPDTAADLYVHHYLLSNPTKDETDVARAKQAELRDRELHAVVRERDHNRCRYCTVRVRWSDRRSSVGGVLDHVDPSLAAGAANLVVACRGCNSRKGNRTPAAAGMTLLPVPAGDPAADLPPDLAPTHRSASDHTTHVPARDGTGRVPNPEPGPAAEPGYAGPAGERTRIGPPRERRSSRHPDPFRRSAITGADPLNHAGLPGPAAVEAAEIREFTKGDDDP